MADDLFPARPEDVDRRVIIEWPQALNGAAFTCWAVSITDAVTGELINAVSKMALHFDAEDLLWADALAFVGEDGHMLTGTEGRLATDDEGRVRTAMFRFLVTQMRTRERAIASGAAGHE